MTSSDDTPGTQRDQRHRAIVDAARALTTDHGAHGFTVDRVAVLAGVSRRTVFNHFSGVDELLIAVCEQILAEVTSDLLGAVDRLTSQLPAGEAGSRAALDAVCEAARGVDLPSAILAIHRALDGPHHAEAKEQLISRAAFEQVGGRLRYRLLERAPDLDPLELELTLTLLTHGLATIAGHWLHAHDDLTHDVPPGARADWDALLERLLLRLRVGHAGDSSTPERPAQHG